VGELNDLWNENLYLEAMPDKEGDYEEDKEQHVEEEDH